MGYWSITKTTNGKIVIKKEGCYDKFIYPEELNSYIKKGWEVVGKSRNKGIKGNANGKIWINDGTKAKRISKEEVDAYIEKGWVLGTFQKTVKGYIRITNGVEDKNIAPGNEKLLQFYLNNGWKKGSHAKHEARIWINKDGKSLMIKKRRKR